MSDDDIAAVLTYLTGLDHAPVTYTADDIKAARAPDPGWRRAMWRRSAPIWPQKKIVP